MSKAFPGLKFSVPEISNTVVFCRQSHIKNDISPKIISFSNIRKSRRFINSFSEYSISYETRKRSQ